MKKYTIDVMRFPEEFVVYANNESEAKEKAKDAFYANNNNGSVYELAITDVEPVEA